MTFVKEKKSTSLDIAGARSLSLQKPHLKHSFTQRQKNQHVATRVWYYHAETLVWRRRERSASGTFRVTDIFVSTRVFRFRFVRWRVTIIILRKTSRGGVVGFERSLLSLSSFLNEQAYTSSTNQTLSKSFSMFDAKYSDEMPLGNVAKTIGTSFGPALDAIEQEYSRRGKLQQQEQQKTTQQNGDIYVPKIPHALPISRMAKDNAFLRDVLIYDEKKKVKPRLSWYDPYDKTWVPNNWFQDGLAADMKYYFGGANTSEASDAAVNGRTWT